jgi:hypothetical protein
LPQRLGRLNTQRPARRCGARQHAHGRHEDGCDHRRDEEIRGEAVGAPREEQDEAVAGGDAAAELTSGTSENRTQHAPGVRAECDTDADLAGATRHGDGHERVQTGSGEDHRREQNAAEDDAAE